VGTWALGLSAVILLLLGAHVLTGRRGGAWWARAAALLGLLGGLVAMASAAVALATPSPTDSGGRAWFGWAALALAAIATSSTSLVQAQPRLAAAGLVAGSSLGLVAISLFDINTYYPVALPLCWIAAALALLGDRPTGSGELVHE
jgi:hypothetical protein